MYQISKELLYRNLTSCHSHLYYENQIDILLNYFSKLSLKHNGSQKVEHQPQFSERYLNIDNKYVPVCLI